MLKSARPFPRKKEHLSGNLAVGSQRFSKPYNNENGKLVAFKVPVFTRVAPSSVALSSVCRWSGCPREIDGRFAAIAIAIETELARRKPHGEPINRFMSHRFSSEKVRHFNADGLPVGPLPAVYPDQLSKNLISKCSTIFRCHSEMP